MVTEIQGFHYDPIDYKEKYEKAKAELAALKAQKCETCQHWTARRLEMPAAYCKVIGYVQDDFACNRWAAREEK
jgi:hypothetical protein